MDFSTVCRTCLSTDALSPIFAAEDHRRRAAAVLVATGVKISYEVIEQLEDSIFNKDDEDREEEVELDDGLPQQMCTTCVVYIDSSLKFRRQCKNTENQLLQLCQSDINKVYKEKDSCEIDDLKFEYDILKTEIKCEFEETGTVISEDESDVNTLSILTDKKNEDSCDVLEKTQSVKVIENEKCGRKRNVQRASCKICGKDLSVRSLRAHMATRHSTGTSLRCGYCKVEHSSKESLAMHTTKCPQKKKRLVSDSGRELVECELCKKLMQRNSLRAHQAVKHKGLGPVCEHCGRRFGNKLRLSEHLRAKHGYAKLQCAHCEFKSSSTAALQNHERRHRGDKPFVCETCGAKFHAAYLLAQHRHSHRTEKRIKCGECGAVFKSSNGLHAHRQARHGARRHRCLLCTRAYSCRHYAVKHLRAVHGFKGTVPPLQVEPAPT